MRTEILGNGILPEYCSIGRDCSSTTFTRPLYHQNQFVKNGQEHDSSQTTKVGFLVYGKGEIRQTILKHETIFRYQVRELHRLYVRQRELVNEMKREKLNKDEHNIPFVSLIQETKNLTSSGIPLRKSTIFDKRSDSLEVPGNVLGSNVENQMQKSIYEFPVFETNSWNRNYHASCANSAFHDVRRPEGRENSSRPNLHLKDSDLETGLNLADSIDGKLGSLSCHARADVPVNSGSTFPLASTNFYEKPLAGETGGICFSIIDSRKEMYGKEHLSDGFTEEKRFEKHSFTGDFCLGKSRTCFKGRLAEPKVGFSDKGSSMCKSVCRRKQMLFGVEISVENVDPLDAVSDVSTIVKKNDLITREDAGYVGPRKCFQHVDESNSKPIETSKIGSENSQKLQMVVPQQNLVFTDCQSNPENPKRGKSRQHISGPQKEANNLYFMNLDSLQNYSNEFFKKTETTSGSFPTSKPKQETSETMAAQIADDGVPRTILGFPICNELHAAKNPDSGGHISKVNSSGIIDYVGGRTEQLKIKDFVLQKGLNSYISSLRHHIDLNLSFEEEDARPAPSLPPAIVKIATTEIDLESPAMIESEADVSPDGADSTETDVQPRKSKPCNEECDRVAAETIVSFSMSGKTNSNEEVACDPPEATSSDCLKWFAETIMSNCSNTMRKVSLVQNGACDADESIPYGMDCFEFMTLKLEDTKEEYYSYKPMELNNPGDEETMDATSSKRSRKGMPNRGRRLKDFQKDILPGLVTLSRQEVTEDLKTFEGLLFKVEGRNSPRNGRGRKRFRVLTMSPLSKSVHSTVTQQPKCQKLGREGRNILGWGKRRKRTKHWPRQRFPDAHLS